MITTKKVPARPYPRQLGSSDAQRHAQLYTTEYTARFEPGGNWNYAFLPQEICAAAAGLLQTCRADGYRAWLITFGPAIDMDVLPVKYPNYSLKRNIQKLGFVEGDITEASVSIGRLRQSVGIFEVEWSKLPDGFAYQSSRWDCLTILSRRDVKSDLAAIREAGGRELWFDLGENRWLSHINWHEVGALLCPRGDIIGKTWGGFDDRERSVDFIHQPDRISAMVAACLAAAQDDRSDGRVDGI